MITKTTKNSQQKDSVYKSHAKCHGTQMQVLLVTILSLKTET